MTTPEQILQAVHKATGAKPDEILTDTRTARVAIARFLAMRLYHETHPWSSNHDAALAFRKKDPSTGRYALMRAEYLLANDAEFRQAHAKARQELGMEPAGVTG